MKVSNGVDTFEVDEGRLHEALKDGFVPTVQVSNGKETYDVHPNDLKLAEADGFRPAQSALESGLRGAAQGVTFGFADELTGLAESALTDKTYEQARDESRRNYEAAQTQNPKSYMAGELGGAVGTSFIPGLGALNVAKGTSLAGRAAIAAAQGGLAGLGMSDAKDLSGMAKDTAIGAGTGAVLQGAGETVLEPLLQKGGQVLSKVGDAAGDSIDWGLKKLGKIGAGVPEEFTQEYLNRGGKISARTESEILDELTSRYHEAESAYQAAKDNLSKNKDIYKDIRDSSFHELQDYKYALRDTKASAKDALDSAWTQTREHLNSSNLMQYKQNILDDIDHLKRKVSEGSTKAFEILDSQPGSVNVSDAIATLDRGIKGLTIQGTPISDSAANSVKNLTALKQRLEALGETVTFPQAKSIIQQLDNDINISSEKGTFAPEADAIKSTIRQTLDGILKRSSSGYRQQMESVAQQAELLSQLSHGFGNEGKVINRLNNLSTEKGRQVDFELMKKLGKVTGTDYETPVNEYLQRQDILNSPSALQSLKESLPEHRAYQDIQSEYQDLLDPKVSRSIDELNTVQNAAMDVSKSEDAVQAAKDNLNIFSPVKPGSAQSKMHSLTGARDYNAKQVFGKIDEATGKNFSGEIKDRAILDSFEKGDTNGSRKTLLGAVLGKAAGSTIGGAAGYVLGDDYGAGMGAMVGFGADKYAGRILKSLLDNKITAAEFASHFANTKFANILAEAASRGNKSLAATHFLLSQQNPEYRNLVKSQDK